MAEVDDIPIGFSESDFARVREVVRYVESSFPPSGNGRPRLPPPTPDGIPIYNDTGGSLGKYSIVRPNAIRLVEKKIFIDVKQPDSTHSWDYLVVGDNDIPTSGYGMAQRGPLVKVLYDTGTPTRGQGYGAKSGQKTASLNYPECLICAGIYDATDKIMWARLKAVEEVIGKLDAPLSQGSTADVSIWIGAGGSESDSGVNVEVAARDWLMKSGATDIASGKKVVVRRINGVPYVTEAECA